MRLGFDRWGRGPRPHGLFCALCAAALGAQATPAGAQLGERVLVEQRVLLQEQLTPASAKRRALEEAMAEAVRRVAGVRVQSSAVTTTTEDRSGTRDTYRSVVQLDAAGRAVDAAILNESWETTHAPGIGDQLYYRATFAITVERELGVPDVDFSVELVLPRTEYLVRSADVRGNDEIVAQARTTRHAHLLVFSIVADSVTTLIPNEYVRSVDMVSGELMEIPGATWRARGLRVRVSLPHQLDHQDELLAVVALRSPEVAPPSRMSLLEFQRWLVRIPAPGRAMAFAPYTVRRARRE